MNTLLAIELYFVSSEINLTFLRRHLFETLMVNVNNVG
jgi:hypothetical protein